MSYICSIDKKRKEVMDRRQKVKDLAAERHNALLGSQAFQEFKRDAAEVGNFDLVLSCLKHHQRNHKIPNELPHDKTNKMACVPSKDSDQPGHPPSLIRVFPVCMKKSFILSYSLSARGRLIRLGICPDWSKSSLGIQTIFVAPALAWAT